MPSHAVHYVLNSLLFGKKKADRLRLIDEAKDLPVKWMGPRHRAVLHDAKTNVALGVLTRDKDVMISGFAHDALDKCSSKCYNAVRRYLLSKART